MQSIYDNFLCYTGKLEHFCVLTYICLCKRAWNQNMYLAAYISSGVVKYASWYIFNISWIIYTVVACAWLQNHDDVIKWKHFPRYWPCGRGIHQAPVNSPHIGQWCGALMFSFTCARRNGLVNNREPGDLRSHSAHYDVTVMLYECVDPAAHFNPLIWCILIMLSYKFEVSQCSSLRLHALKLERFNYISHLTCFTHPLELIIYAIFW